jgi:hypothetical protein
MLQPVDAAIMRTILYGDVFDCALTAEEIHHYLIHHQPVPMEVVCDALATSSYLRDQLYTENGYFTRADRRELIALRLERREIALAMWESAARYGRWLSRLPFVRMVALTGALAAQNPSRKQDDYDYLLVTQTGRVWLARAFAILLVRFGKLRGVVICPNYVLAEDALAQTRRNLFMAREVAQMVPFYGHHIYSAMREANRWTDGHLPNALTAFYIQLDTEKKDGWYRLKYGVEYLLGGWLGNRLEGWEYQRKLRRFAREMKTPNSAAQLDTAHVKGHFNDHGHPVLLHYFERLRAFQLDDSLIAQIGD